MVERKRSRDVDSVPLESIILGVVATWKCILIYFTVNNAYQNSWSFRNGQQELILIQYVLYSVGYKTFRCRLCLCKNWKWIQRFYIKCCIFISRVNFIIQTAFRRRSSGLQKRFGQTAKTAVLGLITCLISQTSWRIPSVRKQNNTR